MNYEALEKLVELKEKGILSEEEFQMEKKKLLNPTSEIQQNTTTQEETTSQIVEQNNYNTNPISQEHKTKGSPEKTVFLVILIPIVIIGIMWFLNKKDSTPSYNYTPSSSYTNTTSTTSTTKNTSSVNNDNSTAITSTNKSTNNSSTQSTSNATSSNTETTTSQKQKDGTATEMAKSLWGEGKEQYGKELLYAAVFYYSWKKLNPYDTPEEAIKERDKYLKNNTPLELAHIYLFNRILSEGEIDLEDTDSKKILQQLSKRASQLGRTFEEDSEDDATNFYLLAYGYAVLANEGKDLDKVFEQIFNEKITPKDAKELFDLFTKSRDVTRSENIPNNDPSYK